MSDCVLDSFEDVVLLRSDMPTRNGRWYTKECLESIVNDPVIQERVEGKYPFIFNQDSELFCGDVTRTVGAITKMHIDEDKLLISGDILNLPEGRSYMGLKEKGASLYFCSVGQGKLEVNPESGNEEVKDYELNYVTFSVFSPYAKEEDKND